jgi:hypothetical protein
MYFLTTRNLHSSSSSVLHLFFLYRRDIRHSESDSSYVHTNRLPTSALPWYSQRIQHPSNSSCSVGVTAICDSQRKFNDRSTYYFHPFVYDAGSLVPQTKPQSWQGRSTAFGACRPVVIGLLVVHARLDRRSLGQREGRVVMRPLLRIFLSRFRDSILLSSRSRAWERSLL